MSSRNSGMPRQPLNNISGRQDGPPPPFLRGRAAGPLPQPPVEEELALRHDEIQRIASANSFVMDNIAALRQELALVKDEIHVLSSQAIPRLHADKELESRDLIHRGLKIEGEMHSLKPIKAEALYLRSERPKLEALREELSMKVGSLSGELKHIQSENEQILAMRAEIHGLQEELVRARMACEYEKKANAELLKQRQAMDRDFLNMNREAENLRAELEKRGRRPGIFFPNAFGAY